MHYDCAEEVVLDMSLKTGLSRTPTLRQRPLLVARLNADYDCNRRPLRDAGWVWDIRMRILSNVHKGGVQMVDEVNRHAAALPPPCKQDAVVGTQQSNPGYQRQNEAQRTRPRETTLSSHSVEAAEGGAPGCRWYQPCQRRRRWGPISLLCRCCRVGEALRHVFQQRSAVAREARGNVRQSIGPASLNRPAHRRKLRLGLPITLHHVTANGHWQARARTMTESAAAAAAALARCQSLLPP